MKRSSDSYRNAENAGQSQGRKMKRCSDSYRMAENTRESQGRKMKRGSDSYRTAENTRESQGRKMKRGSDSYRTAENTRESQERKMKRGSDSYRTAENTRESQGRKMKRGSDSYRMAENTRESQGRKMKRGSDLYRTAETTRESQGRKMKRGSDSYRTAENTRESQGRKMKRSSDSYRTAERVQDARARAMKRRSKAYRQAERMRDLYAKRIKRLNEAYRAAERQRDKYYRKVKRLEHAYRTCEQQRDSYKRKLKRLKFLYKQHEMVKETYNRKRKRLDKVYKQNELERETYGRKLKRMNMLYKQLEKKRETILRKVKRTNEFYRQKERMTELGYRGSLRKTLSSMRLSKHRKNLLSMKMTKQRLKARKYNGTSNALAIEQLIDKFHRTVSKGPCYECAVCSQLWYRHSVINGKNLSVPNLAEEVQDVLKKCVGSMSHTKHFICKTCVSHIKKGKIPPNAKINGMKFPEQGPLKDMNMLELSLLAPVLPFMRIYKAPQGQHMKIQGNMVLVPADVKNSVAVLPRLPDETGTIKAKLKRRLRYRNHIYSLNIRPEKIREGLLYLSETSDLFKEHNIAFDHEIVNRLSEDQASKNNEHASGELNTIDEQTPNNISETLNEEVPSVTAVNENQIYDSHQDTTNESMIDDKNENNNSENQSDRGKTIREEKDGDDDDDDSDKWSEADELEEELLVNPGILDTMLTSPEPRAGPGVERIGRTPPPLAQSVETWPIGVRLVCRELRPVSLEERILVIERVGCGRHATHYFGLNFS